MESRRGKKGNAADGVIVGGIDGVCRRGKKRDFKGKEREQEGLREGKGKLREGCCGKHRGGWWSGEGKLREGLLWEAWMGFVDVGRNGSSRGRRYM